MIVKNKKNKKKIFFGFAILFAVVCSLTFAYAGSGQLHVLGGGGSGNGYILDGIDPNVYSDILGYTPQFVASRPYYEGTEDTIHGHAILLANGDLSAPVYCIEPGIRVSLKEETYNTSSITENMSREDEEFLTWVSYFGYLSPAPGVNHTDPSYYDATQQLVWQTKYKGLEGRIFWFTDNDNRYGSDTNDVQGKVEEIKRLIADARTVPSISAPSNIMVGETKTFSGNFDPSKYTVSLSNNKAATIVSQTSSGLQIKFNTTEEVKITVTKKFKNSSEVGLVYTHAESQNIVRLGYNLPNVSKSITVAAHGGNLQITKISSKSSGFLGDTTLKGAVYTVKYTGSGSYADFELVTGDNGIATTKGTKHDGILPIGTYTIKEKTPSKGYKLDPKTYTATITASNSGTVQQVTSEEPLIEANLQIVKVEASGKTGILTPEPNKVFKLYPKFGDNKDTAIATLTTDADGYAIANNIPYGTYILRQVEPYGSSEPIQPIEITINEKNDGKTLKYVLANAPYSAKVKIVKRNKDTDKVITSTGFRFKIKWLEDENGKKVDEYITQTITLATGKKKKLEYFGTDEDGTVITPEALRPGKYQLEEIKVAEGYIISEEPLPFTISPSTEGIEIDDDYGALLTVDFYNKKEPEEDPEPNPPTLDNILTVLIGGIAISVIGVISYKKIKY